MSNKQHYYYKVSAETATGTEIQKFAHDCQEADEKARQWAEEHGAKHYYESPAGMAGGIAAVEFDEGTLGKEGWERIAAPDGRVLWIPEENTEIEKSMYALTVVSEVRLIPIFQFKPRTTKDGTPIPFSFGTETPIIFLHHGKWYADVPYECQNEECAPISEKEFYRRRMAAVNERTNE